jgi:hypothetical protein
MGLVAGAARVPLDPPLGIPMMGYGARTGVAQARHDPLFARALYCASDPGAGREALLVELDVCLLAPAQAGEVRAAIARRTGVAAERVLVGCTHTHSGPETGLGAVLAGRAAPPWVAAVLDAAAEAGARAHAEAAPARLGVGGAEVRIGRNRRVVGGPVDPAVLVVRVDRAGGAPLAVLHVHGCHPTALGHENLAWSADWPGAAARAIEAALPGALAVFALGAHGDVDPRTRGVMDLAISGQSAGVGFDAMEALGAEAGEAVARAAAALATRADAEVAAAAARVALPVHGAEAGEAERERALAAARADALAALGLPTGDPGRTSELFRASEERTRGLPPEERRERLARARLYLRDRTAPFFAGGLRPEVEVQCLRLGGALLLGLPLEPVVDVGLAWRARAGAPHAAVIGIANGWLRYLPHARTFAEPGAHRFYEVLMSTLAPDAAERLLERGAALAAGLERAGVAA